MAPVLRIVFFGTSAFAIPSLDGLLASRHTVLAAVTRPPRPAGRGRSLTQPPVHDHVRSVAPGLQVLQPEKLSGDFIPLLRELAPDVMVTASYGAWLPENLLSIPGLGVVNVHPSMLPLYRGAAPVTRAILDGRGETGVSFMLTDSGWDTGPVIASFSEPILSGDTSGTLEERLAGLAGERLPGVLEDYGSGKLVPRPQTGEAVYAGKVETAETWLDWNRDAVYLERQVRAFQPFPGARTSWGGRLLKVVLASVSGIPVPQGEVRLDDGILVGCGDGGSLRILRLQPESRGMMTADEFLRGSGMRDGDRLEGP